MTKPSHIKPLPHQKVGSRFLARRKAAGLFDEQGLGKSKQLIDAVIQSIGSRSLDGAVLVCPNHLKDNWREEIAKHAPAARTIVLGSGRSARRRGVADLRGTFYIVNYEAVPLEMVVMRALLKFKRFALVLDESHRIKSPTTKVTTAIHELRAFAAKRYILTGSPIGNRPEDMWSQAFFLDDGKSLGDSPAEFADRYGDARSGYKNLDSLTKTVSTIGIRRTKAGSLPLPPKEIRRIFVSFSPIQARMYGKLRADTRLWVKSQSGANILKNANSILSRLTRLVQVASNPGLIDSGYSETPSKFLMLDKILAERLKNRPGEKIIVWTGFVQNVSLLCRRYQKYGAVQIHGGLSGEHRRNSVASFKNDASVRVLVANPSAAREGLTLTQATCAIYIDRTFNLIDYLQSQDRIHRLGQTKKCDVILLVSRPSIDEYVDFSIEQKLRVAKFIQGDSRQLSQSDRSFQKPAILKALLK